MPESFKKYVFLLLLGAALTSALVGHWGLALVDLAVLLGWLAWETRRRQRAHFVARGRVDEAVHAFEGHLHGVLAAPHADWALFVEHGSRGPSLTLVDGKGRRAWTRAFDPPPLAVLPLEGHGLIWAGEDRLHLLDAEGRETGSLAFEPPLLRQGYRLVASADGRRAFLHTPWFVQAFEPDLSALRGRVRYEDAGHYLKYCAVSPDGRRLLLAGALLLDEETSGGAAMEARWDAWQEGPDGDWEAAWRQSFESYSNTHLRGLGCSDNGEAWWLELYHEGYEFRVLGAGGEERLRRQGGERPVLSADAAVVAWESPLEGLVVARADGTKLWSHKPQEQLRLKQVDGQGRALVLEGRRLRLFDAQGQPAWEAYLQADPTELSLGRDGRLAVALGNVGAVLRLPRVG